MASAVVLARNQHANFLPLKIPRANQPDAGRRNVATQKLNFSVIGRQDFGGLHERNPAVLPALHVGSLHPVFVNDLTNRLLNVALLDLIVPRSDIGDGYVVIPAMAIMKKSLSQGQNILPLSLRPTGLGQSGPDFPRHHEPLNAGAVDDMFGYPLQVGQAHNQWLSGGV